MHADSTGDEWPIEGWDLDASDRIQLREEKGWKVLLRAPEGHRFDLALTDSILAEHGIARDAATGAAVATWLASLLLQEEFRGRLVELRQEGETRTRLLWSTHGLRRREDPLVLL